MHRALPLVLVMERDERKQPLEVPFQDEFFELRASRIRSLSGTRPPP